MYCRTIILVLLLVAQNTYSQGGCNCDPGSITYSSEYINSKDLIFRGKTKELDMSGDYGKVIFKVSRLFKGNSPEEIAVYFNKKSGCNLKIGVGEDWLIYCNYKVGKPFAEYCSRCRKNVVNTNRSVETMYIKSDIMLEEETEKLQALLGTKKVNEQRDSAESGHRNIIPGIWQRILLILASVIGFILIYFAVNRFLKKR